MNMFPNLIDVLHSAGVTVSRAQDFNLRLIATGDYAHWLNFDRYLGGPQAAVRAHYEALNAKAAWTPQGDSAPVSPIPIPNTILGMHAEFNGMIDNLVKQIQTGWVDSPQVKNAVENASLIYALAFAVTDGLAGTLDALSIAAAIKAVEEYEDSEAIEDLVDYLNADSMNTSTLCFVLKTLRRSPMDLAQFRDFDEGDLDYEDVTYLAQLLTATYNLRAKWRKS